ncbi:MAG: MATE family efflux transporter [Gemmatimonadaceae bacterium]|nr:MATE family efflux transporter [Gemmatimonadaceae bacterium]
MTIPSGDQDAALAAPAGRTARALPSRVDAAPRRYDRSLVDGPLAPAVWKLAWPAVLTSVIGGMQGVVDHALVGNYVGFSGNAAIGVSWQILLIVIVFTSSIFTGMSVLVARFAGQGDHETVDRVVYQSFLTAVGMSFGIMAPLGYFIAPWLLTLVNATAEVQAEALPFLRIMFLFSGGMMIFFMLSNALRSAGDARTPMKLGIATTVLNVVLNVAFIRGLGPVPAFGTKGAAIGTTIAFGVVALYSTYRLWFGGWALSFPRHAARGPDWKVIRSLFRYGLPTGIQGIAMNVGGVLLLGFIGSTAHGAEAQATYAVGYTELFSFITWTSQGLLGAAAAIAGQNLGAGRPARVEEGVRVAARFGLIGAGFVGVLFLSIPGHLLGLFGMHEPAVVAIGTQLLRVLALSGLFVTVALTYTGGLQGTGDTKSPLYISVVSQIIIPLGICFAVSRLSTLEPLHVWLAILAGHFSRAALSVWRFRQGKWRNIEVEVGAARA